MKNQRYNAWASYITLLFLLFSATSVYANEPHWEPSYYNSSVKGAILESIQQATIMQIHKENI